MPHYVLCFFLLLSSLGSTSNDTVYSAGVEEGNFFFAVNFAQKSKQKRSNWCWAACLQMMFAYNQIPLSQQQIAKQFYGNLSNRSASILQISRFLDEISIPKRFMVRKIQSEFGSFNHTQIIEELKQKRVLIVGLENQNGYGGHLYVLSKVYYSLEKNQQPTIHKAILFDPLPNQILHKEMDWKQLTKLNPEFLKVKITR